MYQILSDAWFFYRRNFVGLLSYIVPVSLFLSTAGLLLIESLAIEDEMLKLQYHLFVNFFVNPLYLGGLIFCLENIFKKGQVSLKQCVFFGLYRWPLLLAVSGIIGIMTAIGVLAFLIPGIWIFIRLCLMPFLVAIDGLSPLDAAKVSFQITQTKFWDILGCSLLIMLCILVLERLIYSWLPENSVGMLFLATITDIMSAFLTITWYRFYGLLNKNRS